MFDYVESRAFALSPEDVNAAAGAVLAQTANTAPLAIAPGVWQGVGARGSMTVTPTYHLRAVPARSGTGTLVELRVVPAVGPLGWAVLVFFFFIFFPAALMLMFKGRERFRNEARLTAASIFASLGTTSGLVAAGYAAAPPPPM
jgi:hypothetical protein